MNNKTLILALAAALGMQNALAAEGDVKAWEGTLTLPTYTLNAPEKAPIFQRDWSYQRARRSVYPYVLNDNMTTHKEDVTYKALYLENDYIEVCILPEIGGRLFYAIDKTNGYDIVYHNHVVKPANVGMTGAWISGGIEWNVFHHHRATSHSPIDYKIVDNADGSKTVWVGETELRHRMSWAIGITLEPGKSYVTVDGRLMNSTGNDNSMLYWSNIATGVDENYEIIFPSSTEFGTFHCKNTFCHWPITHESFNGIEGYKNNVDARFWRNHFMSNSIFCWDRKEDFIGGYDHGKKAGTMITGNHNIVKGGKFWLWGPNSKWDTKILTDTSGHYIELMVGAYSDNQPDYTWIAPYETKDFRHYFYGLREIGGVKTGDKDYAINLDFKGKDKALVGVNTTSAFKGLNVALKDANKGEIYSKTINVAPDSPFTETVSLPKGYTDTDITMTLSDADGNMLLSYTPVHHDPNAPLPAIVDRPKRPADITNNEECYLVGLRNMQFHNPFIDPTDYFKEVLRRDPGDVRSNTKMGVWSRMRGDNDEAKAYLRAAIKRQTHDYTRPEDCEALYNLGLILKDEGNYEAALDTLYRAVWSYNYNSPANFQLAQIYNTLGDTQMALERLNEAVSYNGRNLNAKCLQASIFRQNGDTDKATAIVEDVLAFDPLNTYAAYELSKLGKKSDFEKLMRNDTENYMELAMQYLHNGYAAEAQALLERADAIKATPTVKMWLGYMAHKQGDTAKASKLYADALAMPVDYVNPFRLETVPVLELAKNYAPDSFKPNYYLGNLWYDKNQSKAIPEWLEATRKAPDFPMTWRNLGWAYWVGENPDYDKSAGYYRKAIDLAPDEALFLEEIDQVYEAKGEDPAVRYALLKSHHDTAVKRYYPLAAEVITGTLTGDYDYALGLLRDCYFPTREGVANFHDVYVDALLTAGEDKIAKGNFDEGMKLFEQSFEYPENHQVFLVDTRTPRDAQIYYFMAKAYADKGNKGKARQYYKKAAEVNTASTDYRYWKGLALEKLGRGDEARELFTALQTQGKNGLVDDYVSFYGAEGTTGNSVAAINTKAYYTKALGELGLGNHDVAKNDLRSSLELKPDNLWTIRMLNSID